MQRVDNPLFAASSDDAPAVADKGSSGSSGRRAARCGCCTALPWLAVLCTLLTVGALVVWHVHTAQVVQAVADLLKQLGAPQQHSDALNSSTRLLQTLVVAVVSALVGLTLVLAAVRQQQVVRKARSLTPADWWHGWKARLFVATYALLLAALWAVAAALVALLCAGVTVTLVALAGSAAAGTALRHDAAGAASALQQQLTANANNTSVCLPACVNLAPLAALLAGQEGATGVQRMHTCVCGQQLLELQQSCASAWRDAVATLAALAVLLAVASVLMLQGVGHCVAACRDDADARACRSEGRAARRRASQPRNWMRVTPSPAAEAGGVAAHVWPELRGLSPGKPVGGVEVADVEQQQLQPDQQAPPPGSVCSLGLEGGSEQCDTACSTNNAQQRPRRRWNDGLGR